MSIPLIINGQTFQYPETGDSNWGVNATGWAAAVTSGMLQKAGGNFQLLSEVDFGTSFGLKSLYYKSRTANVAAAGQIRLARADVISWRNQANDGDLPLSVNASNELQFNGVNLQNFVSVSDTATIDLTLTTGVLTADINSNCITNVMINSAAAIAFSKLATLTSGNILVGSAGNVATSVAMSGDATIIASGALTIANNAISNAKLAQMPTMTIKGNNTGGTANALDLTATQTTAILNVMVGDSGSGGTKGLVPAPATGDAVRFLRGDGTWTNPSGSGDVVGPASAVDGNVALFNGTSGKIIKDSGLPYTNIYVQNTVANGNFRASEGAGTTTLTVADNPTQIFNLSANRNVVLPTTSVPAGRIYTISSPNAFVLTIKASDASTIVTSYAGTIKVVALIATPVTNTDWAIVSPGPVYGSQTNDVALPGYVGELLVDNLPLAPATANTTTNLCTVTLTPGSWDVSGSGGVVRSGGGGTNQLWNYLSISLVSATRDSDYEMALDFGVTGDSFGLVTPTRRVFVASGTTQACYLVLFTNFTGSMNKSGRMRAMRVR